MKNMRYVGTSDVRELSADDLAALGVEPKPEHGLRFEKGVSVPVDDEVAEILMNKVVGLREASDEELKTEEEILEAELGFKLYNPSDHTVEEVNAEIANSPENRRRYILEQEFHGSARKGILGPNEGIAGFTSNPEAETETAEVPEAGGTAQGAIPDTGTSIVTGRASTA